MSTNDFESKHPRKTDGKWKQADHPEVYVDIDLNPELVSFRELGITPGHPFLYEVGSPMGEASKAYEVSVDEGGDFFVEGGYPATVSELIPAGVPEVEYADYLRSHAQVINDYCVAEEGNYPPLGDPPYDYDVAETLADYDVFATLGVPTLGDQCLEDVTGELDTLYDKMVEAGEHPLTRALRYSDEVHDSESSKEIVSRIVDDVLASGKSKRGRRGKYTSEDAQVLMTDLGSRIIITPRAGKVTVDLASSGSSTSLSTTFDTTTREGQDKLRAYIDTMTEPSPFGGDGS